ncbi:hypothetical protein [Vibrio spartinae]|uniref:Pesticin immunity protein n=1 Tax=Vibrio spartinae TaxID=1918945 RepID=A0A1N6LZI2_9VIBR|nr:hypothetical protein [Vibrio spartinae]SIO92527.1 hypothetical protein VSP9026_00140 [Vibrio spartinae]
MKIRLFIVLIISANSCWAYSSKDIYEHLDITSFNSSLIPKISNDEKYFSDFKSFSPTITNSKINIESEHWNYTINIVKENKKGIYVCFTDKAKEGSYDSQFPMIIRKYANDYVAIQRRSNVCDEYSK